jgi:hypothetical protein
MVYSLLNGKKLEWIHVGRDRRVKWPSIWSLYEDRKPSSK